MSGVGHMWLELFYNTCALILSRTSFFRALGLTGCLHTDSGKLAWSAWCELKWIVILAVADASDRFNSLDLARRLDLIDLT